jgi:hypothetical protein
MKTRWFFREKERVRHHRSGKIGTVVGFSNEMVLVLYYEDSQAIQTDPELLDLDYSHLEVSGRKETLWEA